MPFHFYIHETALHIACSNGNSKIVKLLLGHNGIDVDIKNYVVFFY